MNQIITEAEFRKKIKSGGDIPAVYLFYGEEDYLKHNAMTVLRNTFVSPESAGFDSVSIGSAEYSADALRAAVSAPPMFSEYKVVTVSISLGDLRPPEVSDLLDVMEESTDIPGVFLAVSIPDGGIDAGTPKKPSALLKKIAEFAVPVYFERVAGSRLSGWAGKHYEVNGVKADRDACTATVEYCGSDMFRLASEIDKISWYVLASGRDTVTKADITSAGCSAVEFDTFALANAMVSGQYRRALEVLGFLKAQKTEPTKIMGDIIRVICDMKTVSSCLRAGMPRAEMSEKTGIKPYPLGRYIDAVEGVPADAINRVLSLAVRADEGVKGYGRDYVPIEQLICSI